MSPKKKENIVPCLLWVSKGVSKPVPDLIQLSLPESKEINDTREILDPCFEEDKDSSDKEEVDEESNEGTHPNEIDEDKAKDETTSNLVVDSDEDIISKYDLDNYDDNDEDIHCTSIENLQMFPSNKEDEYLEDSDEEDKKQEEENNKIKPDDNLLVVGRYKGVKIDEEDDNDIVIEVYVYNKGEGSFYVHHNMNLKVFPAALEWLDFHPSDKKKGSFVAVGDMIGMIGVWNLDVDGQKSPDYTLERENIEEVVNCLGWNKNLRNILASGYSDGIIVLWNLLTRLEEKVLTYHKGSVQTLEWDPFDAHYILSGCTKGYVKLYDHQKDGDEPIKSWKIKGEIEKVCWNKVMSSQFFCATHRGFVYCFDVSSGLQYKIKAHTSDCITALDVSPDYPNLLMTTSFDRFIKVWDLDHITDESKQTLKPIYRRKTTVGKIFTAKFAPDSKLVVAVGGNSIDNNLKILDLEDLNPDKRRNGEDTTQNNFSENYSDQTSILNTSNGKKRKKKVKNPSAEEDKGRSAPAKKKHKKNLTETSTQNGNSMDTNSQTSFLHQKTHKEKATSKSKNALAKKKRKHKAK